MVATIRNYLEASSEHCDVHTIPKGKHMQGFCEGGEISQPFGPNTPKESEKSPKRARVSPLDSSTASASERVNTWRTQGDRAYHQQ